MRYVRLGSTGLKVSRLCLGCMTYGSPAWRPWVLDEAASLPLIRKALEAGITFLDTADMYSLGESEAIVGKAIRQFARRDALVLATKVHQPMSDDPNDRGLSRKHIMLSIDRSLQRLGTDYVDLYQIHRWDAQTPIEETLDALNDVVRAGKALYLGASSMAAWQLMKALGIQRREGLAAFVSMQNHVNLLYREEEREMLPLCRSEGVGVIPWSPLARGRLARPVDAQTLRHESDDYGRRLYPDPAAAAAIVAAVAEVAAARSAPMAAVALAWLLAKPGVTAPIIGASKPQQLDDALAALDLTLSDDEIARLEANYAPQPVRGHE